MPVAERRYYSPVAIASLDEIVKLAKAFSVSPMKLIREVVSGA